MADTTRLGYEGYGVALAGDFSGKLPDITAPIEPPVIPATPLAPRLYYTNDYGWRRGKKREFGE